MTVASAAWRAATGERGTTTTGQPASRTVPETVARAGQRRPTVAVAARSRRRAGRPRRTLCQRSPAAGTPLPDRPLGRRACDQPSGGVSQADAVAVSGPRARSSASAVGSQLRGVRTIAPRSREPSGGELERGDAAARRPRGVSATVVDAASSGARLRARSPARSLDGVARQLEPRREVPRGVATATVAARRDAIVGARGTPVRAVMRRSWRDESPAERRIASSVAPPARARARHVSRAAIRAVRRRTSEAACP